jgi:hypothetical protein
MQTTSKRLINKFKQGTIIYNQPGVVSGDAWNPGVGASTLHNVDGVQAKSSDKKRYIDGGFIVGTDILLAVAPFAIAPDMAGTISINGVEHQIIMIDNPTVEPDYPLVWFIGCRK